MQVKKAFNFDASATSYSGSYTEPSECPLCKHAIKPQKLHLESFKDDNEHWFITALYLCNHCYQTFVSLSSCFPQATKNGGHIYSEKVLYIGPNRHKARVFPDQLQEISPKFVKVYNQAKAAEENGLDEICGLGYRKALEFLIKDYLVHKKPDDEEVIRKMELGNCIANKVSAEDIQLTASRCAWLGNDHAHYVHHFEEYDLEILKQLLEATIYWVSMKLTVELAAGIERRR